MNSAHHSLVSIHLAPRALDAGIRLRAGRELVLPRRGIASGWECGRSLPAFNKAAAGGDLAVRPE